MRKRSTSPPEACLQAEEKDPTPNLPLQRVNSVTVNESVLSVRGVRCPVVPQFLENVRGTREAMSWKKRMEVTGLEGLSPLVHAT